MQSHQTSEPVAEQQWFLRWLISDRVIFFLIALNALVLFLDAFPDVQKNFGDVFRYIDVACILMFVIEAIVKVRLSGWRGYLGNGWNRFDFLVVLLSLPVLLDWFLPVHTQEFSLVSMLRLGRFLRFSRMLRFMPNSEHIWTGVGRALKASLGVFLVLLMLNMIFAVGATMLFSDSGSAAEKYFRDPLTSLYTLFKVFTVEGWYEVPDELAEANVDASVILQVRIYFVAAVLIGGILGLSLANAVFVDEMTTDNTNDLEQMVGDLKDDVAQYRAEIRELLEELRKTPSG